jgi:hypothetical protein
MNHKQLALVVLVVFNLAVVRSAGALGNTYYVSPSGSDSNSGTDYGSPFGTFGKAIGLAGAGDTIYALGGTYNLNNRIYISKSGGTDNPINLLAYPGETPILDFSGESLGTRGLELNSNADWWYIKGLTIQNAGDNGFYSGGDHGVYEQIVTRYNRDSGFQLHDTASYNLVLNCDSYLNVDVNNAGENADGFALKSSSVGPGNTFRGDRSWGNSDDGYDVYYTENYGILVQDCWSFDNGINIWGIVNYQGDGNGFKLGSPGGPSVLTNDLAVDNAHNGMDINGSTAAVKVFNSTSFSNYRNWRFDLPIPAQVLQNNISYAGEHSDSIDDAVTDSYNSWNGGVTLTSADFQSTNRYPGGVDLLMAPRQEDGSLPDLGGFLHLASGSDLIDAGTPISFTFAGVNYTLPFNDDAPDLGAFETGIAPPALPGDYNNDGHVNAADYTVWRDHLNTSFTMFNDETPGSVTPDDYTVWLNHFGESLGSGALASAAAVPEPAGVVLACWALGILLMRRARP